jgi:hypothetical protein
VTAPSLSRGKAWAYAGSIIGGGLSIAANVAHSFVPPADAPADWSPVVGSVVFSVFWPILLFVAVEILARVIWPAGLFWQILRFGGLLPVALISGIVSYRHLSSLLAYYGEDALVATVGPLAIDGLMVMATAALLVIGNNTRPTTPAAVDTVPATEPAYPATPAPIHPVTPAVTTRDTTPITVEVVDEPALPEQLVNTARRTAEHFASQIGRPITAGELAATLNIDNATARRLLPRLDIPAAPSLNGHAVVGGLSR